MRKLIVILVTSLVFLAAARADNATAGASVTHSGTFFTGNDAWSLSPNPDPGFDSLVNGTYQTEGQQWNYDSIWWNGMSNPANIVITLAGKFLITDLKIQADDNDNYKVEYRGADMGWYDAWDVALSAGGGLRTRGPAAVGPFVTDAFRLTAVFANDYYYSISQFEATGTRVVVDDRAVPDGGLTIALFGAALGLLGMARRVIRA